MSDFLPIPPDRFHIPSSSPIKGSKEAPPTSEVKKTAKFLKEQFSDLFQETTRLLESILGSLSSDVASHLNNKEKILHFVNRAQGQIESEIHSMRSKLSPAQGKTLSNLGPTGSSAWQEIEKEMFKKFDAGNHAEATLQSLHAQRGKAKAPPHPRPPPPAPPPPTPQAPPSLDSILGPLQGQSDAAKLKALQTNFSDQANRYLQGKYGEHARISTAGLYSKQIKNLCDQFFASKNWQSAGQVYQKLSLLLGEGGSGAAPQSALNRTAPEETGNLSVAPEAFAAVNPGAAAGAPMTLSSYETYLNTLSLSPAGAQFRLLILQMIPTLSPGATLSDLNAALQKYVGDPNGDGTDAFPPLFKNASGPMTLTAQDIASLSSDNGSPTGFQMPIGKATETASSPIVTGNYVPLTLHPPADWDFTKGSYSVQVYIAGRPSGPNGEYDYFDQNGKNLGPNKPANPLTLTFTSASSSCQIQIPNPLYSYRVELHPEQKDGTYLINSPILLEGTNDTTTDPPKVTTDISGVDSAQQADALLTFQQNYTSPTSGIGMTRSVTLAPQYSGSTQNMQDAIERMKAEMETLLKNDPADLKIWEHIFDSGQTAPDGTPLAPPVSPKNCKELLNYYNTFLTNTYLATDDSANSNSIDGLSFNAPNLDYNPPGSTGSIAYTCINPAYAYNGHTYIVFKGSDNSIILIDQNLNTTEDKNNRAWWDGGFEGRWQNSSSPPNNTDGIQIYRNANGQLPPTGALTPFDSTAKTGPGATIPALIKDIVAPLNVGYNMSLFRNPSQYGLPPIPPTGIDSEYLKQVDPKYRYQASVYNLYMRTGLDAGLNTYLFDFQDVLGLDNTRTAPTNQLVSLDLTLSDVGTTSSTYPIWATSLINDLQPQPPFTGEEGAFAQDLVNYIKTHVKMGDDPSVITSYLNTHYSSAPATADQDLYYSYPGLTQQGADTIYNLVSKDASPVNAPQPTQLDQALIQLKNLYPPVSSDSDAGKILNATLTQLLKTPPQNTSAMADWVQNFFSDPNLFKTYPSLLTDPAQINAAANIAAVFQSNAMFTAVLTNVWEKGTPAEQAFSKDVLNRINTNPNWKAFGNIQTQVKSLGSGIFDLDLPSLTQTDVNSIYALLQLGTPPTAPFGSDYLKALTSSPWSANAAKLFTNLQKAIQGANPQYPLNSFDRDAIQKWIDQNAQAILGPGNLLTRSDVSNFEQVVDGESIQIPTNIGPPKNSWDQFIADMTSWIQKGSGTPEYAFLNGGTPPPLWALIQNKTAPNWDTMDHARQTVLNWGSSIYTLNQTKPNQLTTEDVQTIYDDLGITSPIPTPPAPPPPATLAQIQDWVNKYGYKYRGANYLATQMINELKAEQAGTSSYKSLSDWFNATFQGKDVYFMFHGLSDGSDNGSYGTDHSADLFTIAGITPPKATAIDQATWRIYDDPAFTSAQGKQVQSAIEQALAKLQTTNPGATPADIKTAIDAAVFGSDTWPAFAKSSPPMSPAELQDITKITGASLQDYWNNWSGPLNQMLSSGATDAPSKAFIQAILQEIRSMQSNPSMTAANLTDMIQRNILANASKGTYLSYYYAFPGINRNDLDQIFAAVDKGLPAGAYTPKSGDAFIRNPDLTLSPLPNMPADNPTKVEQELIDLMGISPAQGTSASQLLNDIEQKIIGSDPRIDPSDPASGMNGIVQSLFNDPAFYTKYPNLLTDPAQMAAAQAMAKIFGASVPPPTPNLPDWAQKTISDLQSHAPPFTGKALAFANDLVAWIQQNVKSGDPASKLTGYLKTAYPTPPDSAHDLYYKYPGLTGADAGSIYSVVSTDAGTISAPQPTAVDLELIALTQISPAPTGDAQKLWNDIETHLLSTDPTIDPASPSGLNAYVAKLVNDPSFWTNYPGLLTDPAQLTAARSIAAVFKTSIPTPPLPQWAQNTIKDLQNHAPPFTGKALAFANDLVSWIQQNVKNGDPSSKLTDYLKTAYPAPPTAAGDLYYKYPGLTGSDASSIYSVVSSDAGTISAPAATGADLALIALTQISPAPTGDAQKLWNDIETYLLTTDPTVGTDMPGGLNAYVRGICNDPSFWKKYPQLLTDPAQMAAARSIASIFKTSLPPLPLPDWAQKTISDLQSRATGKGALMANDLISWIQQNVKYGDAPSKLTDYLKAKFPSPPDSSHDLYYAYPGLTSSDATGIYAIVSADAGTISPPQPTAVDLLLIELTQISPAPTGDAGRLLTAVEQHLLSTDPTIDPASPTGLNQYVQKLLNDPNFWKTYPALLDDPAQMSEANAIASVFGASLPPLPPTTWIDTLEKRASAYQNMIGADQAIQNYILAHRMNPAAIGRFRSELQSMSWAQIAQLCGVSAQISPADQPAYLAHLQNMLLSLTQNFNGTVQQTANAVQIFNSAYKELEQLKATGGSWSDWLNWTASEQPALQNISPDCQDWFNQLKTHP